MFPEEALELDLFEPARNELKVFIEKTHSSPKKKIK